jgi:hypothetical protein
MGMETEQLEDDDDFLGTLSKPVKVVRARTHKKVCISCSFCQSPTSLTPPSAPSAQLHGHEHGGPPNPHILGEIVEMGFLVSQARKALSTMKDGMDVQPTLESFLNRGRGGGGGGNEEREQEREHHPARQQ